MEDLQEWCLYYWGCLCCRMIWRAMSAGMFMDCCTGQTESTGRPLNATEMHWKLILRTSRFYGTCHFCKFVILPLCPSVLVICHSTIWSYNPFGRKCLSCLSVLLSCSAQINHLGSNYLCCIVFNYYHFMSQIKRCDHASCSCNQQDSPRTCQRKAKPSEIWGWFQAQMRDLTGFVETRRQLLTLKPSHRNNWIGFAVAHHMNAEWDSLSSPCN